MAFMVFVIIKTLGARPEPRSCMIRLNDLMTCQRFELIRCFLHVITKEEEAAMASDPPKKIRLLREHIKKKCIQFYQTCQYLFIDERMAKSKARCHLVQYMKNKPCKWGFRYWVIAYTSGYTVDFDLYAGKAMEKAHMAGIQCGPLAELIIYVPRLPTFC